MSDEALEAALALAVVLLVLDFAVDLALPLAGTFVVLVAVLRLAVVPLAVPLLAVDDLAEVALAADLDDGVVVDLVALVLAGDRRVVDFPFAAFCLGVESDA